MLNETLLLVFDILLFVVWISNETFLHVLHVHSRCDAIYTCTATETPINTLPVIVSLDILPLLLVLLY